MMILYNKNSELIVIRLTKLNLIVTILVPYMYLIVTILVSRERL